MPTPPHLLTYAIMLAVLALLIWRRVRRQFGRQPIRRKRMIARVVLFSLIGVMLAVGSLRNVHLTEGLLVGALAGAALGWLGIKLTRFEVDPSRGDCYVPNPWIGALLVSVLLGRLLWRFLMLWPQMQAATTPASEFGGMPAGYASSPLTMLMIGMLVGYYIVYFSALLIHHRRFQQRQAKVAAA